MVFNTYHRMRAKGESWDGTSPEQSYLLHNIFCINFKPFIWCDFVKRRLVKEFYCITQFIVINYGIPKYCKNGLLSPPSPLSPLLFLYFPWLFSLDFWWFKFQCLVPWSSSLHLSPPP